MTVCMHIYMQIYDSEYMCIEVLICTCVCENAYLYVTLSFTRHFFQVLSKNKNHFKESSHVRWTWTPHSPFWCLNAYESKQTNASNFRCK